ncbi:MAG: repair protein RadC [Acidobacteriota bacterium]|nr:repair protein RadC [Acidobacteriota bacterium]
MIFRIADLPEDEHPLHRLFSHGPTTLSDAELLSLVLATGTHGKTSLDLAREILVHGLESAARRDWTTYRQFGDMGRVKAARVAASFELGRRAAITRRPTSEPVRDAEAVARPLLSQYRHATQERFGAICLDAKNRVVSQRELYVGTLNSATISTRDVLRYALDEHAASVIVFHNHTSGDPTPSPEDLIFTRKLVDAGKLLGIEVVDHLILGVDNFISLKQRGAI